MSYATRHKQETEALLAGRDTVRAEKEFAKLPIYDQMLALLNLHKKELHNIQSFKKKNEQKAIFLKDYAGYISGNLSLETKQPQNDVLAQLMLWAFDCSEIETALQLFEFGLKNKFVMPPPQKRTFSTAGVEEAADTYLRRNQDTVNYANIQQLERILELLKLYDADVLDVVTAKVYKAIGDQALEAEDYIKANGAYNQALSFDNSIGVKGVLRKTQKLAEGLKNG